MDITEEIPTPLARTIAAGQQAVTSAGTKFDLVVGGIGFTVAASDQRPYVRQTAPVQKQQLDTSKEAGEQTLDGYWTRSQTSWHHGAGIRYYEPGSDETTPYRFEESLGVDVFTKDKVTLLKRCSVVGAVAAGQTAYTTGAVVGGADVLFTNENGVVKRRDSAGAVLQTYTPSASAPEGRVAVGGTKIFVGATSFGIDSSTTSGTTLTRLYTQALATTPIPYWVKSRLIAVKGRALYELAPDGSSGTTPGNLDTVTPLYTHPDTGWTWSDVAEGPAAVYASGYSNGRGAIFRFSLEDAGSGTTPVLSQAYQVAEFPVGEEVLSLRVHLGTYIGIGTTKGLRVGIIANNGDLQYGPLLVSGVAVRSLTSSDKFIYGAVTASQPDGKSGLVAVDLSEELRKAVQIYVANTLVFPYSWHARTDTTGRVDTVSMLGASGRVAMGVFGEGVYLQSATLYEPTGWVRSGRVRYATVEHKKYRTADVGAFVPDGAIGLYVIDEAGTETYIRNLTATSPDGRRISLSRGLPLTYEYVQFRLTLSASASGLVTPVLDSLQVKAVPVTARQELIQYPLLCMDRERTLDGLAYGREGHGFARFSALKTLETESAVVTVHDETTGETFEAQIETVEFRKPGPKAADGRKNWGGFLSLTVRK